MILVKRMREVRFRLTIVIRGANGNNGDVVREDRAVNSACLTSPVIKLIGN